MHFVAFLAMRFGIPVYFDVSQTVALALISILRLLQENPTPAEEDIRFGMAGNLCRCTGYQNIAKAILAAASELNSANKAAR